MCSRTCVQSFNCLLSIGRPDKNQWCASWAAYRCSSEHRNLDPVPSRQNGSRFSCRYGDWGTSCEERGTWCGTSQGGFIKCPPQRMLIALLEVLEPKCSHSNGIASIIPEILKPLKNSTTFHFTATSRWALPLPSLLQSEQWVSQIFSACNLQSKAEWC